MTSFDAETDLKPIIIIIIIIQAWAAALDSLPSHLFNFARKALLQVLPTAANLKRWNRVEDPSCPLCACGQSQTNKQTCTVKL